MEQDKPTELNVVIESSIAAAEGPRQWLLSELKRFGYGDDDVFAVHLAFEEAFYNAMKHGNKMNADKKIKIYCVVGPEKIEISLTDAGSGFNPCVVPDCRVGENLYKTEGRGLFLIHSYMDVVEFNESGNTIHMVRYRHGAKNPASKAGR